MRPWHRRREERKGDVKKKLSFVYGRRGLRADDKRQPSVVGGALPVANEHPRGLPGRLLVSPASERPCPQTRVAPGSAAQSQGRQFNETGTWQSPRPR